MEVDVSFITTVKNGEKFLSEVIESVMNQTIENWEYIIINDGSTDGTWKLLKEYSLLDPRIKVFNTKGLGRGRALNLAIKKTVGKYIANVDADDPCHPQKGEIQANCLANNIEFSLIATNSIYLIESELPVWEKYSYIDKTTDIKDITITKDNAFRNESINHSSVMFRKEDLIKVGLYDELRNSQFDYELWIRFSINNYRIGLIPFALSSKRIHSRQSFEKGNRINYLKVSLSLNKFIIKNFKLPLRYHFLVHFKFFYGLLPQYIRKMIRKTL
ncbi:glycosyltransferase family 2 protein [Cerasibacillus sp. JNUCC 74]